MGLLRKSYFSEALRDKAIKLVAPKAGKVAADIGAGTGFMTEGLVAAGLRVIAVDESKEMLEVARRKTAAGGSISYRQGAADNIPIETGTVDYVFANMLLHHVEDPRLVLREMQRILTPGGALVLTDLDRHNFEFLRTEQHDRWMGFDRGEVADWLGEAGMEEARVEGLKEDCRSKSESGQEVRVGVFAAVALKPARKTIK